MSFNFSEDYKEFISSAQFKRVLRAKAFSHSFDLFFLNYQQLLGTISYHVDRKNFKEIWPVRKRYRLEKLQVEIMCFLHNFSSSAISLIDHTRVLYRELYEPEKKISNYQAEIDKRFKSDPLSKFIHDLRHFSSHVRLPSVTSQLIYNEGKNPVGIIGLSKNELMEFRNWSAPAQEYIDSYENDINVERVVRDYYSHVSNFHKWFQGQQQEVHKEDLSYIGGKQAQLWEELSNVPDVVRSHWKEGNCSTLHSLEDAFAPVIEDDEWERIDQSPPDPVIRCNLILDFLKRRGLKDDEFEEEVKRRFSQLGVRQVAREDGIDGQAAKAKVMKILKDKGHSVIEVAPQNNTWSLITEAQGIFYLWEPNSPDVCVQVGLEIDDRNIRGSTALNRVIEHCFRHHVTFRNAEAMKSKKIGFANIVLSYAIPIQAISAEIMEIATLRVLAASRIFREKGFIR